MIGGGIAWLCTDETDWVSFFNVFTPLLCSHDRLTLLSGRISSQTQARDAAFGLRWRIWTASARLPRLFIYPNPMRSEPNREKG